MHPRALLFLIPLALIGACSRSVPIAFPPTAAASADAPAATPIVVGRALREDPPLPGEPTDGWVGLEPSTPGHGGGHAH